MDVESEKKQNTEAGWPLVMSALLALALEADLHVYMMICVWHQHDIGSQAEVGGEVPPSFPPEIQYLM